VGSSPPSKLANLELVKVVRPFRTELQNEEVEGPNYKRIKVEGTKQNNADEPIKSEIWSMTR
jgi:hypothetical protein